MPEPLLSHAVPPATVVDEKGSYLVYEETSANRIQAAIDAGRWKEGTAYRTLAKRYVFLKAPKRKTTYV